MRSRGRSGCPESILVAIDVGAMAALQIDYDESLAWVLANNARVQARDQRVGQNNLRVRAPPDENLGNG